MKRFLFIVVLGMLAAWPARAQEALILSNLDVSLWPEFDRPEVLVIYRGLLAPDTPLPTPVEIYIPASAGEASAVAYVGDDGARYNQPHSTRVEGDWIVVSFELANRGFQLEFYDTLPVDDSGKREYVYEFTADYAIGDLNLDVQKPPAAQGFEMEPPADSVEQEVDGLVYHMVQVGELAQGEKRSWAFSYQKDTDEVTAATFMEPTAPAPAMPPSAEGTGSGGGLSDNSGIWIFLIAFVALVGVGAGAFWLGRRTQPPTEVVAPAVKRQKRRGSGRGPSQDQGGIRTASVSYCYKCGEQLRPGSDFCQGCGAAVRRD